MINYTYSLNEEIARWATEVYIKKNPRLKWWIAFTNPTAGPWKKVVVQNEDGTSIEIYRFVREEERPDLILVNDDLKIILIVEAKDYVEKLISGDQMEKSIRVIQAMTKILSESQNPHWAIRKNYRVVPAFLWMCETTGNIQKEDKLIQSEFLAKWSGPKTQILNIIISKDRDENLENAFVYNGEIFPELNFKF
jgi:hypothetical protein